MEKLSRTNFEELTEEKLQDTNGGGLNVGRLVGWILGSGAKDLEPYVPIAYR